MLDQLSLVPFLELVSTEDTTRQGAEHGQGEEREERLVSRADVLAAPRTEVSDHVVREKNTERDKHDDLQDEARHGYVDSDLACT